VPRYRYDQLMRIGWKVFLPLSLAFVVITAGVMKGFDISPWTMTEEAHEMGRGYGTLPEPEPVGEPVKIETTLPSEAS